MEGGVREGLGASVPGLYTVIIGASTKQRASREGGLARTQPPAFTATLARPAVF